MVYPCTDGKIQTVREACAVLRIEVIILSWCSRGVSLMERNFSEEIVDDACS